MKIRDKKMEDILVMQNQVETAEYSARVIYPRPGIVVEPKKRNQAADNLSAEVDENFLKYLSLSGLSNEEKLLVLSSKLHYYYDYDELKEVTTLINLKKLNLINHLDEFLHSLYNGLSPKANFVGCFADRRVQKGNNVVIRLYKKLLNFLDDRIDFDIDRKSISRLLESHGFRVMDMTEINGLTYFRTQNFGRMAV